MSLLPRVSFAKRTATLFLIGMSFPVLAQQADTAETPPLSHSADVAQKVINGHPIDIQVIKDLAQKLSDRVRSSSLPPRLQKMITNKVAEMDAFVMDESNPSSPRNLEKSLIQELRAYREARLARKSGAGREAYAPLTEDVDAFEAKEIAVLNDLENLLWTHLQSFGVITSRFHLASQPFGSPMSLLAKDSVSDVVSKISIDEASVEAAEADPDKIAQVELNISATFEMKKVGLFRSSKVSSLKEDFAVTYRPSELKPEIRLLDPSNKSVTFAVSGRTLTVAWDATPVKTQTYDLINDAGKFEADASTWKLRIQVLRDGVAALQVESKVPEQGRHLQVPKFENQFAIAVKTNDEIEQLAMRKLANVSLSNGIQAGRDWATTCENFIQPNGEYGAWGKAIHDRMTASGEPEKFQWLMGNASAIPYDLATAVQDPKRGALPALQPRLFTTANKNSKAAEEKKIRFWIWFAAAVAQAESGCQPGIKVKGTYGIASGLWQLDLRKPEGYAENACEHYFNTLIPQLNAECGLKMLNNYSEFGSGNNPNPNHLILWKGNYWQTMHLPQSGARKVVGLVRLLNIEN